MSSLTVKDRIKKLVAAEDPAKPLTDQQLVEVLAAEQVKIARRTVTKYRCELRLPRLNRRQQHGSAALGAGPAAASSQLSPTRNSGCARRLRHKPAVTARSPHP